MKKDRHCKHCKEIFENVEGRVHANHVRWCHMNPKRNSHTISKGVSKNNTKRFGEFKEFDVTCHKCGTEFKVKEREPKFPQKEKYFCSRSCANSRIWSDEINEQRAKANSIASKALWNDPEYAHKCMSHNRRFTSKVECLIRDYFRENFPDDEWTFGGVLRVNDLGIARDLYSKKLKICVEYDGIWHFKDIKGQLANKQLKDAALEKWCKENGYRLIRMSESFYHNCDNPIELLKEMIYSNNREIIKIGEEYV